MWIMYVQLCYLLIVFIDDWWYMGIGGVDIVDWVDGV